jgi:hypothetical protein
VIEEIRKLMLEVEKKEATNRRRWNKGEPVEVARKRSRWTAPNSDL